MANFAVTAILALLVTHSKFAATEEGLIALPDSPNFHITQKSLDRWSKVGQSLKLSCYTNKPWSLCRWTLPDGTICDRRNEENYEVACKNKPRVKFQKKQLGNLLERKFTPKGLKNQDENECTLTILESSLEDHGNWTCEVTDDPFANPLRKASTSTRVFVASPYELEMLERPAEVLSLLNNSIHEEVTCISKGSSQVKPHFSWFANGQNIDQLQIFDREEKSINEEIFLQESITIDEKLIKYLNINTSNEELITLDMKCLSTQSFPNGTAIFENSRGQILTILTESNLPKSLPLQGEMNVPAIAIVSVICILVLIAIAVLCYAQKYNKWCYTKPNLTRAVVPASANPNRTENDENNGSAAETTELFIEEAPRGLENTAAETPVNTISTTGVISNGSLGSNDSENYYLTPNNASEAPVTIESMPFTTVVSNEASPIEETWTPSFIDSEPSEVRSEPLQTSQELPSVSSGPLVRHEMPSIGSAGSLQLAREVPRIIETQATPNTPKTPPSLPITPGDGFFHPNDAIRLMELVSSPPPRMPPNMDEKSGLKLSLPQLNNATLSDGLTTPRRIRNRKENEYVNMRPLSFLNQLNSASSRNRLSSVDSETMEPVSAVTTAAVIEHNNMNRPVRPNETAL